MNVYCNARQAGRRADPYPRKNATRYYFLNTGLICLAHDAHQGDQHGRVSGKDLLMRSLKVSREIQKNMEYPQDHGYR